MTLEHYRTRQVGTLRGVQPRRSLTCAQSQSVGRKQVMMHGCQVPDSRTNAARHAASNSWWNVSLRRTLITCDTWSRNMESFARWSTKRNWGFYQRRLSGVTVDLAYQPGVQLRGHFVSRTLGLPEVVFPQMTGFSHCTNMAPVKSHNDFSRQVFGRERSCVIELETFLSLPWCEHTRLVVWSQSCRTAFLQFWSSANLLACVVLLAQRKQLSCKSVCMVKLLWMTDCRPWQTPAFSLNKWKGTLISNAKRATPSRSKPAEFFSRRWAIRADRYSRNFEMGLFKSRRMLQDQPHGPCEEKTLSEMMSCVSYRHKSQGDEVLICYSHGRNKTSHCAAKASCKSLRSCCESAVFLTERFTNENFPDTMVVCLEQGSSARCGNGIPVSSFNHIPFWKRIFVSITPHPCEQRKDHDSVSEPEPIIVLIKQKVAHCQLTVRVTRTEQSKTGWLLCSTEQNLKKSLFCIVVRVELLCHPAWWRKNVSQGHQSQKEQQSQDIISINALGFQSHCFRNYLVVFWFCWFCSVDRADQLEVTVHTVAETGSSKLTKTKHFNTWNLFSACAVLGDSTTLQKATLDMTAKVSQLSVPVLCHKNHQVGFTFPHAAGKMILHREKFVTDLAH